jgi:hypothetical protein
MSGVKERTERKRAGAMFRGYRMTGHKRNEDLLEMKWEQRQYNNNSIKGVETVRSDSRKLNIWINVSLHKNRRYSGQDKGWTGEGIKARFQRGEKNIFYTSQRPA